MKPIDFVKWLEGFLDAQHTMTENEEIIHEKLWEVDKTEPSPMFPQYPIGKRGFEPTEDGKVPFHTVCGCEVCGCTMANDLVYPPDFKINVQTSDNTQLDTDEIDDNRGHNEIY